MIVYRHTHTHTHTHTLITILRFTIGGGVIKTEHIWNSLPVYVRLTDSHSALRRTLKTHLFNIAFIQFTTRIWMDLCTAQSLCFFYV